MNLYLRIIAGCLFLSLPLWTAAWAEDTTTRESFNKDWRFERFGTMPDGSQRVEPGNTMGTLNITASSENFEKARSQQMYLMARVRLLLLAMATPQVTIPFRQRNVKHSMGCVRLLSVRSPVKRHVQGQGGFRWSDQGGSYHNRQVNKTWIRKGNGEIMDVPDLCNFF